MINKIKGAIFDMDGTIVDSLGVWKYLWTELGKKYKGTDEYCPPEEVDRATRTKTLVQVMEYIHSVLGMGESPEELLEAVDKLIDDYYETDVVAKDGAVEFLEYCKKSGIKMCIASASAMKLIKASIRNCNLGDYFSEENILSCADIGAGKDKPDIYIAAMEYLGTTKEDTCVFEDSPLAVETASKLGLMTVGIYDQYNYGQEEMKKTATVYIEDGETLMKLVK